MALEEFNDYNHYRNIKKKLQFRFEFKSGDLFLQYPILIFIFVPKLLAKYDKTRILIFIATRILIFIAFCVHYFSFPSIQSIGRHTIRASDIDDVILAHLMKRIGSDFKSEYIFKYKLHIIA